MKKIALIIFLILPFLGNSQQEKLPFHEIGNYPEEYSEINLVSRMIEGLGYRYYWATESLNEKDLNEISQKIISNVEEKANAKLRS